MGRSEHAARPLVKCDVRKFCMRRRCGYNKAPLFHPFVVHVTVWEPKIVRQVEIGWGVSPSIQYSFPIAANLNRKVDLKKL